MSAPPSTAQPTFRQRSPLHCVRGHNTSTLGPREHCHFTFGVAKAQNESKPAETVGPTLQGFETHCEANLMIAHRKMIPPPTKWPSRQGRRDWMTASALHRVCRMLTANAEPARLHSRPDWSVRITAQCLASRDSWPRRIPALMTMRVVHSSFQTRLRRRLQGPRVQTPPHDFRALGPRVSSVC